MATFVAFQLVKVAAYAVYKKSDNAGVVALRNFVGNSAFAIEAQKAQEEIRQSQPLLLHPDETILMSFQCSQDTRDHSYLTSHRILLHDTKGMTKFSKRDNYKSIPYGSIQAYSLQTNGVKEKVLTVWSAGSGKTTIAFAKGQVDVWQVQQFLNVQCLNNFRPPSTTTTTTTEAALEPASLEKAAEVETLIHWLAEKNQTKQMEDVAERLLQEYPVLLPNETIDIVYPWTGGLCLMTNLRAMSLEVQKSTMDTVVELKTVLWPCVQALKLQTQLDESKRVSVDFWLYTNIRDLPPLHQCHKEDAGTASGIVDRTTLCDYVTKQLLAGATTTTTTTPTDWNASIKKGRSPEEDDDTNASGWFDHPKHKPLDAAEMTTKFGTASAKGGRAILLPDEKVEMAFQGCKGSVMVLFTTLRVVRIDPQATKGGLLKGAQQASVISVPWKCMVGFGVRTASDYRDEDAEVLLWTEMEPNSKKLSTKKEPGMSYFEFEFSKTLVDIIVLKKYLAQRCFAAPGQLGSRPNVDWTGSLHPQYKLTSSQDDNNPQQFDEFLKTIERDEDMAMLDTLQMDTLLHKTLPVLLDEEVVAMAFRVGRDVCVFTNGRILLVDIKGWKNMDVNRKVEYTSIPYSNIRAFSLQAQNDWQSKTELRIHTRNAWTLATLVQDFGNSKNAKTDLIKLQQFLSSVLLGGEEDTKTIWNKLGSLDPLCEKSLGTTWRLLVDICKNHESSQELLSAMTQQLTSELPILLQTEVCEQVHHNGTSVFVYTNLRVLVIESNFNTSHSLQIKSLPFQWVGGYEVETAASSRDPDAEVYITSDINGDLQRMEQKIPTKEGNVMEMQSYLTGKILF